MAERLAALASLAGVLGTAGGAWLSLEMTKAKKLLGATVVIAGGTPSEDPTEWLRVRVCLDEREISLNVRTTLVVGACAD